jgi:hypothetical protein
MSIARCGRPEDDKHLFFDCSFARVVWFASPVSLRADALLQAGHGLRSQIAAILQQGPSQATAGTTFSIMWCLWKARNDHRFNSLNWLVPRVLQETKAIDGAYTLAFQEESTLQATTTPTVVEASHFSTLQVHKGPKIFCDASVDSQNLVAGNQTGIGFSSSLNPLEAFPMLPFLR